MNKDDLDNQEKLASQESEGGFIVMLIDDEAVLRAFGEDMLKTLGYNPIIFTCTEEALQHLKENHVHLIITDHHLGENQMSGAESIPLLRAAAPEAPIILYTANGGRGLDIKQLQSEGMSEFLHKPVDFSLWESTLASLLK